LIFLVAIAIFIAQPYCRYLCPLGAIYSIFNRFSLWKMKSPEEDCELCGECSKELAKKICPTKVDVYQNPNHSDCIRCLDCTHCPEIEFKLSWKK
jgi:polyferredoxin